jgi:hypothetical protein
LSRSASENGLFQRAQGLAIRRRHHNPQLSIPAASKIELGSGMAAGAT